MNNTGVTRDAMPSDYSCKEVLFPMLMPRIGYAKERRSNVRTVVQEGGARSA